MITPERKILLNPGPATTTDTVKAAMVVSDICPREEEFCHIVKGIRDVLAALAGGTGAYSTILFGGSGTAGVEAVISSVAPPGGKISVAVNGAYGERMARIAAVHGVTCVRLDHVWGEPINMDEVEKTLRSDPEISSFAMVHHETTTGMLNDIRRAGDICRQLGVSLIVDAISSFGGIPLDVSDCNISYMVSTSNKCLQGMPGISFVIAKKDELQKIAEYPKRSFYLDLHGQFTEFETNGQFRFTPPVQVLYALKQAIGEYIEEGVKKRNARYRQSYSMLKQGLGEMGFRFLVPEGMESEILITVIEPDDLRWSFGKMHDYLYSRGFTIYPGKVHGARSFRLSVMGAIYPDDVRAFLETLSAYIKDERIEIKYAGKEQLK